MRMTDDDSWCATSPSLCCKQALLGQFSPVKLQFELESDPSHKHVGLDRSWKHWVKGPMHALSEPAGKDTYTIKVNKHVGNTMNEEPREDWRFAGSWPGRCYIFFSFQYYVWPRLAFMAYLIFNIMNENNKAISISKVCFIVLIVRDLKVWIKSLTVRV